jgi:signal transduction histidine kinase
LTHLVNRTSAELEFLNRSLEQRVEEEVAKNRQKDHLLLQQNRHAAMGEMVRNIAHQWRQPLNSLAIEMQNIELAHEEKRLDGEYLQKRLEKGRLLIDQMSATIDDFSNFFMPSKAKVLFCINETILDVLAIMEATFKHLRIDVELNGMEEPVRYVGHENEFAHVILNLLNNAKDAMVASGVLKPRIVVELTGSRESVRIEIADNGGGIDESVIEQIFDPYFTTKQDTKGMGVGLYMSKMIIEEHMGGRLEARNNEEGAVFTITLPQN